MSTKESPFACDITAIAPAQRESHFATIQNLFTAVERIQELPNGYAFHFPNETRLWMTAAEFVSLERLCCPFFDFRLEAEREHGGISLTLTGRDGVKPFIMEEIGSHLTTKDEG